MTERTTGYSLLTIGILIMIFAAFQIISVFTGKAEPITLFQMEQSTISNSSENQNNNSILDQIQNAALGQNNGSAKLPDVQIIDPEILNSILNLTVYYVIMQFLLSLGFKLANLGTQLLRPIQIKMKNRTLNTEESLDN